MSATWAKSHKTLYKKGGGNSISTLYYPNNEGYTFNNVIMTTVKIDILTYIWNPIWSEQVHMYTHTHTHAGDLG